MSFVGPKETSRWACVADGPAPRRWLARAALSRRRRVAASACRGARAVEGPRVPAKGRNGLSLLSHERQLGSNGIGVNSPVEAAGGRAAGERIPGRRKPSVPPRAAAKPSRSAEAGAGRKKSLPAAPP